MLNSEISILEFNFFNVDPPLIQVQARNLGPVFFRQRCSLRGSGYVTFPYIYILYSVPNFEDRILQPDPTKKCFRLFHGRVYCHAENKFNVQQVWKNLN